MTRAQLHRRLRSRLHRDQRGFTLIETVMAITVIFASLTTLAYTATIGFRYVAVSRDRVQATAYANRVMEEIRALPYAEVTKGLAIEDLSGDADVQPCDVGYCFGDRQLVAGSFPGGRDTSPLYPHVDQVAENGIELTRKVYVTNGDADPLTEDEEPFHVTVIVTWGSASLGGATREVRVESDFYSPRGCVSSSTHPFAAPCQPFFYGRATVPSGGITFEGTFYGEAVDVTGGLVTLPGLQATVQQEQTTTTGAFAKEGEAILVDSLGTQEADGAETMRVDTDTDPSTADVGLTAGYAEQTADDAGVTWNGQTADGDLVEIAPIAWGNDRYQAASSAETTGAETFRCPPGTTTVSTSELRLPCAGARLQKLIHARVRLELNDQSLGSAFLARLNAPTTTYSSTSPYWWQANVQRESTSGDGRIDAYASRYMGSLRLGGFPSDGSGLLLPSGEVFTTGMGNAQNFCLRIDNYAAAVSASAGYSAGAVDATQSGSLHYYDQATGKFSPTGVNLDSASLSSLHIVCERGGVAPNGQYAKWRVEVLPGDITPASVTESPQAGSEPFNDTQQATATATPPVIRYRYQILVGASASSSLTPVVDLVVSMNLGELIAQTTYGPPPPRG